ncbi:hypothetical protein BGW38_000699 [Lunasporangiospora selenospora]|uniref:Uncharacterized protein n=1 Tax=Lunasporangiospora selenospora TaxID=979761 RepID=A0A9P6G2A7_9FUNG|nr:hypothetical protein BGW38_000699 [Lunasporangiospora selenospora]
MASNGPDQQRESHLISLKVLRLSRPSLVTGHGLYFGSKSHPTPKVSPTIPSSDDESLSQFDVSKSERPQTSSILTDALSDLSFSQLERVHPAASGRLTAPTISPSDPKYPELDDLEQTLDMGDFGVSELLMMPAAFGNIYLGETFTSYICANNESAHPVRDVILKAELQTTSVRFGLSDTLAAQRSPLQTQMNQAPQTPRSLATTDFRPTASLGGHVQLLESGKTNEMIVSHEIKELGTHILICSVQYTTLDGQQKSFRKFYKFQVLNPLSVKTKVNHPSSTSSATTTISNAVGGGSGTGGQESGAQNAGGIQTSVNVSKGGLILLEAMIQNVSGVTMWMERLRFEVADAFTAKDLNMVISDDEDEDDSTNDNSGDDHTDKEKESMEKKDDEDQNQPGEDDADDDQPLGLLKKKNGSRRQQKESIFGDHDYFAPNDVRQYLYVLTPKPGKEQLARTTNILGKMDILWRSQFGETGRLQTSQLTRKPVPLDEIAVEVVSIPERIRLEEVFTIEIVVKNQSFGANASQGPLISSPGAMTSPAGSTSPAIPHGGVGAPGSRPRSPGMLGSQSSFSGPSGPNIGGMLTRPPAALPRGGIPTSRPFDGSSTQTLPPSYQQQQQQQSQGQLHTPSSTQDPNTMKLMLTGVKQKMGAILLSGPSSRQLGSLPVGGEVRVKLDWFPLTSGVQKIGGIRIADIVSGYTIELDHLTHCFVEHT